MHHRTLNRRDAAIMAGIGLISWLMIVPLLAVAFIELFERPCRSWETVQSAGLCFVCPFIYGWQVIRGPWESEPYDIDREIL